MIVFKKINFLYYETQIKFLNYFIDFLFHLIYRIWILVLLH